MQKTPTTKERTGGGWAADAAQQHSWSKHAPRRVGQNAINASRVAGAAAMLVACTFVSLRRSAVRRARDDPSEHSRSCAAAASSGGVSRPGMPPRPVTAGAGP
ncbi:hypothetical protein GCM10022140_52200 [Rhodococcus aetherivorans]